ncbi:hypothetical protein [Modestobacter sp. KNN46-3]|jgi:hypothetical protein|uniref:hypothetical protein n=1 Tax=Modestobacter sp. KNN46-3 TaxID=2711218 RepID=UPI0013DF13B2|nr:hypothetical protein [Modestobacter sp. KNN46-3]
MIGDRAGDGPARNRVGDSPALVGGARNWPAVLDALEGDVHEAEATLARGRAEEIAAWGRRSTDWIPPSNLGPLPDDLRERAARLLQHQLAVAEALVERITQSQKQRDVAARMSYAPARPVASFIDRVL